MSGPKSAYLNYKLAGSYSGLAGFMKNRKKWQDKAKVEEELRKIKGFALHKDVRSKFKRRHIKVHFIGEIFSADLKDISRISSDNNNNKFILVVLDAFSKKAYTRPLKNKSSECMIKAFKSIFREAGHTPIYLFTGNGILFSMSD